LANLGSRTFQRAVELLKEGERPSLAEGFAERALERCGTLLHVAEGFSRAAENQGIRLAIRDLEGYPNITGVASIGVRYLPANGVELRSLLGLYSGNKHIQISTLLLRESHRGGKDKEEQDATSFSQHGLLH